MPPISRPARGLAALALLWLATPRAAAQAPADPRQGIELVVLVDVSGSMHPDPTTTPDRGNDPERIRWDAVLLSMNLLTAEDRVLIIPFNDFAPARVDRDPREGLPRGAAPDDRIPGKLGMELVSPRSPQGEALQKAVDRFAHADYSRPGQPGEWNGDWGGTAILSALDVARRKLGEANDPAGRPDRDRQRFIILLTDGQEASTSKPAGLEALNRYETEKYPQRREALDKDPSLLGWLGRFAQLDPENRPDARVKVFTIGLGKDPDGTLLNEIAIKTGGHYDYVTSNSQLIDTFRKLIWQLKGCWTKEPPIAVNADGTTTDLVSGIRDLGVLSYQLVDGQGPRNSRRLEGADDFLFAWSRDGAASPGVEPVFLPSATSYTYRVYEAAGSREVPGRYQDRDQLATSWNASAARRYLDFAKRTTVPLFRVEMGERNFVRCEAMRARVVMDPSSRFRSEEFELRAFITATGRVEEPILKGPVPLKGDPSGDSFQCEVALADLKSFDPRSDRYTLAIEATGVRAGRDHSLLGYKLELPPIDLGVENELRLRLVDGDRVKFTNRDGVQQKPVRIRPERSLQLPRGSRPIALKATLARRPVRRKEPDDRRPEEVDILRVDETKAIALRENDVGKIEAELDARVQPTDVLGLFEGGEIVVSSADPAFPWIVPLRIPFQVAISPRRLAFNFRNPRLAFNPAPDAMPVESEEIQVTFDGEEVKDGPPLIVSIPPQNFGPNELWLHAPGAGGPRNQTLRLPRSNDKFQIAFRPRDDHNEPVEKRAIGYYSFELSLGPDPPAPGYEYVSGDGRVELLVQPPGLRPDASRTVRLQLHRPMTWPIPVGLEGGVPVNREVTFQSRESKTGRPESPRFVRFDGKKDEFIAVEPYENLRLTASRPDVKKPLWIRLSAPPGRETRREFQCGTYTLENGWISAELTEPVPVKLTVIVDDLDLQDAAGDPLENTLYFYPIKGRELVRKIRVFNRTDALKPEEVDVVAARPFFNVDRGDEASRLGVKVVSRATCQDRRGRAGVEIGLAITNPGASFEQSAGEIDIQCKKRELHRAVGCVVQQVELLRRGPAPAAKK